MKMSAYLFFNRRFTTALLFGCALVPQAHAVAIAGQGNWETTLQARDLDGNLANGAEAYYDTELRITWLADAFQARTSGYRVGPNYSAGAALIWPHAVEWADNLTLYGITDWRLPKSFDMGSPGCVRTNSGGECGYNVNPNSSELAHMFHVTLGNVSYLNSQGVLAAGRNLKNSASFSNLYSSYYWSETSVDSRDAWNFDFGFGTQDTLIKTVQGSAVWAVLDGDRGTSLAVAAPVPEPSTYALMALGVAGLALVRRREKAKVR
jgi:hypothetical protein